MTQETSTIVPVPPEKPFENPETGEIEHIADDRPIMRGAFCYVTTATLETKDDAQIAELIGLPNE